MLDVKPHINAENDFTHETLQIEVLLNTINKLNAGMAELQLKLKLKCMLICYSKVCGMVRYLMRRSGVEVRREGTL